MVEFVEADCVAPAGDDAGGLVYLAGVVPGIFEGCVGEDQGWGCDPAHERAPGPRILTPGRVPAQHAIGCLGDEHHGVSAQVNAVDEDNLMHLIDDRAERP